MAAYSDINGFPEAGFPVLSDVSDRVCLNTLYWNPLKEAGFILDVVGNNRLAGNLSLAGMLSGVTSITMNGALSGVSTITANGTATLTSSNPLSLTDVNANISMPGLNSSIGSILERVNKGYFKNLDVANALTVNGNDVALIGDINRYVSGTSNTLPKYNTTGITDSKFTDDGATPKYNSNTLWHSGNDGSGSGLDSDLLDGVEGANYMRNYDLITNPDYTKTVVGLVRLDNTNINLDSHAEGKLFLYRDNGFVMPVSIEYKCNKIYNTTNATVNYIVKGLYSGLTVTPVTFTYNSIKYFGFSITVVSARVFKALSAFTSDIKPFAVNYYNTNTLTVLNSEINGSIGSDFVLDTALKFNSYDIYHANNLNLSTVDFAAKDLTVATAKVGTLAGYLKGTAGTVGAVTTIPQADITNLVSDLSNKQPLDGDLTAIAAIATTSGLLRKTATDTWILDTDTYLTAITKSQVEAVLTGSITTHTHNYQPLDTTLTSLAAVVGVQGDLLYASGTDAWTRLVKSTTANSFLKNSGTNNNPAWSVISESDISFTDTTNGDVSTLKHGYFPKLPTASGKFLRDDLTWQNISGGGVPGGLDTYVQFNNAGAFEGSANFTYNLALNKLSTTGEFSSSNFKTGVNSNGVSIGTYITPSLSSSSVSIGWKSGGIGDALSIGNVAVGHLAGSGMTTANDNTFSGYFAGKKYTTGGYNVCIGSMAGSGTGGVASSGNVFIGNRAGMDETGSNKLIIDAVIGNVSHNDTESLIYGDFASSVASQKLRFNCGYMGFYGTAPIVKPTITGSKGGNAALASLLTQLSNLGLITDSTT